jgi:hypothetical protein
VELLFLGVLAEEKERERIALPGSRKRFFLCRNDQQSGNNENTKPTPFRKWGGLKQIKWQKKAETKYLKLSGLEPLIITRK